MTSEIASGDSVTPRVYVVLGASGAIGSAVCERLADARTSFVLCARSAPPLEALAQRLRERGARAMAHTLDATHTEEVEAAIAEAIETDGRVDGVANCVGSILLKPAHQTSDAELEETLRQNLWSAFACVRGAARAMRTSGGSVLLFASAAAQAGIPNHEAIAAAKGAVIGLTRSAAATYAPMGIRVNCLAPGLVRTPLARSITGNELALKASAAMHALGRIGEPEDIAPAAAWLLSPESSWVTGQVVGVDGGLAMLKSRTKA